MMSDKNDENLRDFDRSLPMALLRARESVMKKFNPSLRENDLSSQQWRVIRALKDEEGLDISELAERCYLLMPSLSRIIQNLEKRCLVSRAQSESDNRRSVISLTGQGEAVFNRVAPESLERYNHITERFGYGKLELLYELLEELIDKLEDENEKSDEK